MEKLCVDCKYFKTERSCYANDNVDQYISSGLVGSCDAFLDGAENG